MTIEEMRTLHQRALNDAEAKQTELRLVLASRYRELVGSSDEVTKMRERSQELDELVSALPKLMEKLLMESDATRKLSFVEGEKDPQTGASGNERAAALRLRQNLSCLPRVVHRALDKSKVYEATESLMELFRMISEQTDEYPLATALSSSSSLATSSLLQHDALLRSQIRMTFLHVQTLPVKITRISKRILHSAASFGSSLPGSERHGDGEAAVAVPLNPKYGAHRSAAALSALDMLTVQKQQSPSHPSSSRPVELLDMYFDAKAKLLQSLLDQLNNNNNNSNNGGGGGAAGNRGGSTNNAEEILSKIVLIIQYDIILHPYQIFVLRKFPTHSSSDNDTDQMMRSLPLFPAAVVQTKASNFLSAHLPLIRTKVKIVLVDIAGTTASALGKIRQSLYDKTDGVECTEKLNDSDGICTWDDAVGGVVDVPSLLVRIGGVGVGPSVTAELSSSSGVQSQATSDRKFSLWSVLFSNTFSSLVHSLLTSSFQSVHTKLVSTLRLSLTNAPPLQSILPHEAYRNTLNIASQLDSALLKVSDDAHELLVHAEERVESEQRLRQSLYVQTCEIMGRLICELRRMLLTTNKSCENYDAVKHLILGRLCHLLKFRLTALSTLLDPNSSPAVLHHGGGMISIMELSSAFELADDNDDGLITFQEAMEAVDSAFSGTHFHGAEMVRETLLLPAVGRGKSSAPTTDSGVADSKGAVTPKDVTLDELTLLLARGLRHDKSGGHSALGAIQNSLDRMVKNSFHNWAKEVLKPYTALLSEHTKQFVSVACTSSEEEYQRLYMSAETATASSASSGVVTNVSPHVTSYLINISFALNRSICPSDSLLPVPYTEYAVAMGVDGAGIPRTVDTIRCALLKEGLEGVASILAEHVGAALEGTSAPILKESGPSGIAQLKNDLSFLQTCFFTRNQHGFGTNELVEKSKGELQNIIRKTDILFRRACNMNTVREIEGKQEYLFEACELFVSSLFGKDKAPSAVVGMGDLGIASSDFSPQIGGKTPLFHPPLESSCRFPLLPIQADRTLSGVQARGKYKEKEENERNSQSVGSGAVRAGFGFFSSMLKTS